MVRTRSSPRSGPPLVFQRNPKGDHMSLVNSYVQMVQSCADAVTIFVATNTTFVVFLLALVAALLLVVVLVRLKSKRKDDVTAKAYGYAVVYAGTAVMIGSGHLLALRTMYVGLWLFGSAAGAIVLAIGVVVFTYLEIVGAVKHKRGGRVLRPRTQHSL